MKKRTLVCLLLLVALPFALAGISTVTTVFFNVGAVLGYTLTLPGQSAVIANSTGAATANIEFNSTSGTDVNIDAKVVGGTTQSDGTPIFSFDNTGSVNVNLSVILDTAMPACMNLKGNETWNGVNATQTVIGTTNVTVVNNLTPSDPTKPWYMKTNFSACSTGDTTTRTLRSHGEQAE